MACDQALLATHIIESGRSVQDVQKLLGHSRIETTMIYVHIAAPPETTIKSPLDDINPCTPQ